MRPDELRAVLEVLNAQGVRRACFDGGGTLIEVEFAPGGPAVSDDAGGDETGTDETAPYQQALEQIRRKRFVRPPVAPVVENGGR